MSADIWHKDGAIAQIRAMADWAEGMSTPSSNQHWETAKKIAHNLRAAADAVESDRQRLLEAIRTHRAELAHGPTANPDRADSKLYSIADEVEGK